MKASRGKLVFQNALKEGKVGACCTWGRERVAGLEEDKKTGEGEGNERNDEAGIT